VGPSPDMPKVILLCEGIFVRLAEITDGWQVETMVARGGGRLQKIITPD